MSILPNNPHDQALQNLVRPADWKNSPDPDGYDFIAIGGGTAGLVSTGGAAMLGAKVALIEKERLGGDCLVTGCVPSKALLHAASLCQTIRQAPDYGIRASSVEVDFPAVMERLRQTRAKISHDDSAQTVSDRGIDLLYGSASFSGPNTLLLGDKTISFKRAIICTGSRPRLPDIPGLTDANPLTSDTVFNLTELPKRLAIIGTGAIGCELGQAFARLGSKVTLIGRKSTLLPKEDPEAGEILQEVFRSEGVRLALSTDLESVSSHNGGYLISGTNQQGPWSLEVDRILVATGRTPNLENLNLEAANIGFGEKGVHIDAYQRTSNKRVYAAGDIANSEKFTHAAYSYAEYATLNALAPVRLFNASKRHIPHCTYTSPEVAHIGPKWQKLQNGDFDCYRAELEDNDRAKIYGGPPGFAKLYTAKGKDRILAATIVSPNAGELIATISLGMTTKCGLSQLGLTVMPYPTRSEIMRRAADQYSFKKITPTVTRLAKLWFRFMG